MIIKNSNAKLGKLIGNINMPVGTTCRKDAPCFKMCYGRHGNYTFKSVAKSITNNYRLFTEDNKYFFDMIDVELTVTPFSFIRWHSIGDIPNADYFNGMIRVAKRHRKTKFLCFTKQYEIVNTFLESGGKIPRNLIVVFSNWGNWQCENPFNLPTAWVRFRKTETYIPKNATECNGFCGSCVNTKSSCWSMKCGDSVVFNQH